MARGKVCTVCASPDRAAIDGQLLAGVKQKNVAEQFPGLSRFALSRHSRRCLAAQPVVAAEGDDEQLALWIRRADDLYVASGAALDLRGQSAAITAAFRAMEFRFKHAARLEEQAARDLPDSPNNWSSEEAEKMVDFLDKIVAEHEYPNTDGDAHLKRIDALLRMNAPLIPLEQQKQLCREIEALILASVQQHELLPVRAH